MNEGNIIAAAMVNRDAWRQFQVHGLAKDLTPLGQFWISRIGEFYERDESTNSTDTKLLREAGLSHAPERNRDTLAAYYDDLPIVGVSSENVVAQVLLLQKTNVANELTNLLTDPNAVPEKIQLHMDRWQELQRAYELGTRANNYLDFDNLDKAYDEEHIVPLYPKKLRSQLLAGGALPGHTILIYGRPESGKSLYAISMAAYAAYRGKRVLYCGNEEAVETVGMRIACNLARRPIREFQGDSNTIRKAAQARGLDRITVMELAPGTFAEIEKGVQDTGADLLVIDQLTGVDVGESSDVRSMDKAARAFRTLCKSQKVVGLAVSQAGDRTEKHGQLPPTWLSMSDVYGSRTGIPAQMDLMLGLGFDEEMYDRDQRAVSIPKNKLGGTHDGFIVSIDTQKSFLR
jgi:hypothetical protein